MSCFFFFFKVMEDRPEWRQCYSGLFKELDDIGKNIISNFSPAPKVIHFVLTKGTIRRVSMAPFPNIQVFLLLFLRKGQRFIVKKEYPNKLLVKGKLDQNL